MTFLTEDSIKLIVHNTNLYSVQKNGKCVNTMSDEIKTFIGMNILMGIVRLSRYDSYWSRALRYPAIADLMSLKRFEQLRRFIHVVDNYSYDTSVNDKLFKIRPLINAVRNECVKIEPEEYHAVDEQIIPTKTKTSKIRQYNPKKPRKWGFTNLVRAGASGIMYDFFIYCGKADEPEPEFEGLQKCARVVV